MCEQRSFMLTLHISKSFEYVACNKKIKSNTENEIALEIETNYNEQNIFGLLL